MKANQRGFSMLYVVGLIGLATITAVLVINTIQLDHRLLGHERQRAVAREAASGGLMEFLNDHRALDVLPTPATPQLRASYNPQTGSFFSKESDENAGQRSYNAEIQLLRIVPMLESSHGIVRAVVYDVHIEAEVDSGLTSGRVRAETFKVSSAKPGLVLPRRHAR